MIKTRIFNSTILEARIEHYSHTAQLQVSIYRMPRSLQENIMHVHEIM